MTTETVVMMMMMMIMTSTAMMIVTSGTWLLGRMENVVASLGGRAQGEEK
jgi:hypothetical protein